MNAQPVISTCPTEILEAILFNLDGYYVARLTAVCREWNNIIKGSAALQYRIRLTLEGFVEDLAHPPLPLADRISALERYEVFWNQLLFSPDCVRVLDASDTISSGNTAGFPVGRWLVDMDDLDHPRIAVMPPHDSHNLVWKHIPLRSTQHIGRMFCEIALQHLDMLIVLSERSRDHGQLIPRIELLDADTLAPHSLPAHADLPWPPAVDLGDAELFWTNMGLCGETLKVTFLSVDSTWTLMWNWTSGALLCCFPQPTPQLPDALLTGVVLLAENVFCWAEYQRDAANDLVVVLVVNTFDQSGELRPRGRWAFPPLVHVVQVQLQADESDEIYAPLRTQSSYVFANSVPIPGTPACDNLVALEMSTEGDAPMTFYMLRSTFLHRPVGDPEDVIPWHVWGPENAHFAPGSAHSIHCCRALHNNNKALTVLTFVPAKCRAAQCGLLADAANFSDSPVTWVERPFLREFHTRLPHFTAHATPSADYQTTPTLDECSIWREDGRVVWARNSHPSTFYIATL